MSFIFRSDWEHGKCAVQQTKIPMTSLVSGNFCFDYCSYRFGFRLGLGLGPGFGLVFLDFITKCLRAQNVRQGFSFIFDKLAPTRKIRFKNALNHFLVDSRAKKQFPKC